MLLKQVVSISALASSTIAAPALVQRFNGERALEIVGRRDLAGLEKAYALMRRRPLRKRSELRSVKRQVREQEEEDFESSGDESPEDGPDSEDEAETGDDAAGDGARILPTGPPRVPGRPTASPTTPITGGNTDPVDNSGEENFNIQPTGPARDVPSSSSVPAPTPPPANDGGAVPPANPGGNPAGGGSDSATGGSEPGAEAGDPLVVRRGRSINVGAIVGGVLGGLVAIVLAIWFFMRSKKRRKQETQAIPFILESPVSPPPMAAVGGGAGNRASWTFGFDAAPTPANWEQFSTVPAATTLGGGGRANTKSTWSESTVEFTSRPDSQFTAAASGLASPQQAHFPRNADRI